VAERARRHEDASETQQGRGWAVNTPDSQEQIPVTILTGFLGAGKTTLLNRILSEPHGRRIAVIENEFGPEGVDNDLLVHDSEEQIVEMNNGCVCCTVRGDLARILVDLGQKRAAGDISFERVVIETTGMANPGPVTQTFFVDEDVGRRYRVDGVITVVDAKYGHGTLDRQPEAQNQVGFADRILLSKADLVEPGELDSLRDRLVRMNPRAPIRNVHMGQVAVSEIFDIGGFNLDSVLQIDPDFLAAEHPDAARAQRVREPSGGRKHDPDHDHAGEQGHHHDHAHDHAGDDSCEACAHGEPGHGHGHRHAVHDDAIKAFVFRSERPFDARRLEETMSALVQVYGPDLLRYKGVLFVRGSGRRMILQGVHMLMGVEPGRVWERREPPSSKMVFIGRNLPRELFVQGLESCLVR
jgi:G3E family GTPase